MNSTNSDLNFFHLVIVLLLSISGNALAISTTEFGALGDGVTDDTSGLQAALTYCSDNDVVCEIPKGKKHLVTKPIFLWGGVSLKAADGGGGIDFRPGDTSSLYLLNLGISRKKDPNNPSSNLRKPFTGVISNITFAIVGPGSGRIIYFWRSTGATISDNIFNLGASNYSATSSGNNNDWLAGELNYIRENVIISKNVINATAGIGGSEGIGLNQFNGATIQGNTVIGVGDDPIGIHFSKKIKILHNVLQSTHGRIYISNSSDIEIAYNKHSRIASLADGKFYTGNALLYVGFERYDNPTSYFTAPEDHRIHDNELYYPPGATDNGAAIYVYSPRDLTVERNWIVNDSSPSKPLYGIYLLPVVIVGWKDPTGIDPDDHPRVHAANINKNANIGINPLAVISTGPCADYVGPVRITNNVGTAAGTTGVGAPGYLFYCSSSMTARSNKSISPAYIGIPDQQ